MIIMMLPIEYILLGFYISLFLIYTYLYTILYQLVIIYVDILASKTPHKSFTDWCASLLPISLLFFPFVDGDGFRALERFAEKNIRIDSKNYI